MPSKSKNMFRQLAYPGGRLRIQTLVPVIVAMALWTAATCGVLCLRTGQSTGAGAAEEPRSTLRIVPAAGMGILGILIVSTMLWSRLGNVSRRLRELNDGLKAAGRGDYSRRLEAGAGDECGELARTFNEMAGDLTRSREQMQITVDTLKTAQAELMQHEKFSGMSEFIRALAHELNNPLTSVVGFSDMLRQADLDPKHKHQADLIHQGAMRTQKIVQAVHDAARRNTVLKPGDLPSSQPQAPGAGKGA